MLVLTRKVGEQIFINENIRVSVERIQGSRVRIGVDAPDDVGILRGELVFELPAANEPPAGANEPSEREPVGEPNLCAA